MVITIPKEYIKVKEMANRLGISLRIAYKYVHTKGFPAIALGRSIRIPVDGMDEWLEKRRLSN